MPQARFFIISGFAIGLSGLALGQFGHAFLANNQFPSAQTEAKPAPPQKAAAAQPAAQPILGKSLDDVFAPVQEARFAARAIALSAPETKASSPSLANPTYPLSTNEGVSIAPAPAITNPDLDRLRQIISLYRAGDNTKADAQAKSLTSPISKTTAEWAALRLAPKQASYERLTLFLRQHPDWPSHLILRKRVEDILFNERTSQNMAQDYFKTTAPVSPAGQLVQARLYLAQGRSADARMVVSALWRDTLELPASTEQILREFGALLTPEDHKWRADRLFYKDQQAQAAKIALLAGSDANLLHQARVTVLKKIDVPFKSLPTLYQNDPSLTFARIKTLIRDEKWPQAAALMNSSPRDVKVLVDGDEWWALRRTIARKLLDLKDANLAYRLNAEHSATSLENRLEAEFQAGWIALRFLKDAKRGAAHFARLAATSSTPLSISRAAYWQGRAADALGDHDAATRYWHFAAQQTGTYYGQLARALIGQNDVPIRKPDSIATGAARDLATHVVEQIEALNAPDLSVPLIVEAARNWTDLSQLSALAGVLIRANDAHATLLLGKYAGQRGLQLDEAAWPIFGIPNYQPLANSAPPAIVYAIARQESSFEHKAKSTAGAKGLMQMISSTAKRTAERAGVSFEEQRFVDDPSFNAQLGAAHLGDLINENRGSLLLTFAAYNAGARRVKEWIAAYGDPRDSAVDPIDWVERIPFTETRNYVQRVTENLAVYRARFGEANPLRVVEDLRGRPRL